MQTSERIFHLPKDVPDTRQHLCTTIHDDDDLTDDPASQSDETTPADQPSTRQGRTGSSSYPTPLHLTLEKYCTC
eukprot:scaffold55068_cov33-Tisochrysis_lutea.AAC.3